MDRSQTCWRAISQKLFLLEKSPKKRKVSFTFVETNGGVTIGRIGKAGRFSGEKGGGQMTWSGGRLKTLAKEKGVSLTKIGKILNVSRQTVTGWTKTQVPKGDHLVRLSTVLEVSPGYFFPSETPDAVSVPLHRKRKGAKLTKPMIRDAREMAYQYEKLFRQAPSPGLVRVMRVEKRKEENVLLVANELRSLSGIGSSEPMNYRHTFSLLASLNIITIFRHFPPTLKDYAFYCKILEHRVVFVDNHTNVLDLIFPLLHETVHAVCDDEETAVRDPEEEQFCDDVANAIQFPPEYVETISTAIDGRYPGAQINILKDFAGRHGHALFGIVKILQERNQNFNLEVGGADTNLKKEFQTIGEILFASEDARDYVDQLRMLSPRFVELILGQLESATARRLTEWLGLQSILDGKQVIQELKRISKSG